MSLHRTLVRKLSMATPWLSETQPAQTMRLQTYLVSFPKCGRTWLRALLGYAFSNAFAIDGADPIAVQEMSGRDPRVPKINTLHEDDPFNKRPDELNGDKSAYYGCRILFLVRDPLDVLVSSYFEKTKRDGVRARGARDIYDPSAGRVKYSGTISEYFEEAVGGFETIITYYAQWYAERAKCAGFALVRYEDLHADTPAELGRIMAFLGVEGITTSILQRAADQASFANMRKMESSGLSGNMALTAGSRDDPESFKTRRGVVGDHRNYMSLPLVQQYRSRIRDVLPREFGYWE